MNARKMLARALANAAPPDDAEAIVSLTIELAAGEADALDRLLAEDPTARLLANALEARLTALTDFLDENVQITWKPGRGPATKSGAS